MAPAACERSTLQRCTVRCSAQAARGENQLDAGRPLSRSIAEQQQTIQGRCTQGSTEGCRQSARQSTRLCPRLWRIPPRQSSRSRWHRFRFRRLKPERSPPIRTRAEPHRVPTGRHIRSAHARLCDRGTSTSWRRCSRSTVAQVRPPPWLPTNRLFVRAIVWSLTNCTLDDVGVDFDGGHPPESVPAPPAGVSAQRIASAVLDFPEALPSSASHRSKTHATMATDFS